MLGRLGIKKLIKTAMRYGIVRKWSRKFIEFKTFPMGTSTIDGGMLLRGVQFMLWKSGAGVYEW